MAKNFGNYSTASEDFTTDRDAWPYRNYKPQDDVLHTGASFFFFFLTQVGEYSRRIMDEIPKTPYKIVPLTEKDTDKVIHFLRKFFFRDEPLNVAIGILDESNTTCPELEEYCTSCISDGKENLVGDFKSENKIKFISYING